MVTVLALQRGVAERTPHAQVIRAPPGGPGSAVMSSRGSRLRATPDADGYLRVMSNADRLAPILEDERRFIDMETSSPGLYSTVLRRDAV